jgi:hypothetical protein
MIVQLILPLVVAGFFCWLVTLVPMIPVFRQVIIGLMVLALVIYLLSGFGLIHLGGWRWKG